MTDQDKLAQLQGQIDQLLQQQMQFSIEISCLQKELNGLHVKEEVNLQPAKQNIPQKTTSFVPDFEKKIAPPTPKPIVASSPINTATPETPAVERDWEQYIGGNIINKIGIVVLLIGLGLFVKYAIDKGLFPPTIRIMLGYLSGLVLTFLAWRLKEKYVAYSAVLFGGGMATLYFTSYIGCTFFQPAIIPVLPAFNLMAVLMAVTLLVAGRYDSQIIGLLGLVGAYSVPFLVNTGSENFLIFFSYITLINAGVLVLSAKKVWRTMTWAACIITWIIASFSLAASYSELEGSVVMWVFIIISFQIFFAAILAHQLWNPEGTSKGSYVLVSINTFFFYILTIFMANETLTVGRLTFLQAIPHFAVAYLMYVKLKNKFPAIFFTIVGLVFLTAAIPISFGTKTVICLWAAETVLLFLLARKFAVRSVEIFAFIVGTLAILLLMGSWDDTYFNPQSTFPAWLNWNFAIHLGVIAGAVCCYFINKKLPSASQGKALGAFLTVIPITLLYFLFFNELYYWFELEAKLDTETSGIMRAYQFLWLLNYSMLFLTALGGLNLARWRNTYCGAVVSITATLLLTYFLVHATHELNYLRDGFLRGNPVPGFWMIGIRYVCYFFLTGLVVVLLKTVRRFGQLAGHEKFLPLLPHFIILVLLSNELGTAVAVALGTAESPIPNREGFSILWGAYSLLLIGLGIWKKSQVLRVAGICLLAVTLCKVFFMDLVNLPIVSRTILFIGLGMLLLFTSYLYQKFKDSL